MSHSSTLSRGLALCAIATSLAVPQGAAEAKPPGERECIASGPPGQLQRSGSLQQLPTVQLADGHWAVRMDRPDRPKQIQLVSQEGQLRDLAKPRPFKPFQWFGRGSAVYALGLATSLQDGKPNLVLVRWLAGRRPRVISLWQAETPDVDAVGAVSGDMLGVVWSTTGADGKRSYQTGTADLERVKVSEAHRLRLPADAGPVHLMPRGPDFALVWTQGNTLHNTPIDQSGRPSKPAHTKWKQAPNVIAAQRCGDTLFVLEGAKDALRLMAVDGETPRELVRFRGVLAPEETQLTCTGEAAVVGRRVWNERSGNIAFWVSTIDSEGNRRDRRVKDMKGKPDEIQLPRLSGSGSALTAFWTEGRGARTELYARPIGCR